MQRADYQKIKESIVSGDFSSAKSIINSLGGIESVLGGLEKKTTPAQSVVEPPFDATGAIARWNELVPSNKAKFDASMEGSRLGQLSKLCRDKKFVSSFDEVCRKCEAVCAAVQDGWKPDLWWVSKDIKDGVANWFKVLNGEFDFLVKSKKRSNSTIDRIKANIRG